MNSSGDKLADCMANIYAVICVCRRNSLKLHVAKNPLSVIDKFPPIPSCINLTFHFVDDRYVPVVRLMNMSSSNFAPPLRFR